MSYPLFLAKRCLCHRRFPTLVCKFQPERYPPSTFALCEETHFGDKKRRVNVSVVAVFHQPVDRLLHAVGAGAVQCADRPVSREAHCLQLRQPLSTHLRLDLPRALMEVRLGA